MDSGHCRWRGQTSSSKYGHFLKAGIFAFLDGLAKLGRILKGGTQKYLNVNILAHSNPTGGIQSHFQNFHIKCLVGWAVFTKKGEKQSWA